MNHHNDPALIAATATIVAAVLHSDMLDMPPLPRLIAEVVGAYGPAKE